MIASHYLAARVRFRAGRGHALSAFESYQQLRCAQGSGRGVYVSFFLMLTLMILVGATWMDSYMTAKRITRPVQLLATAAYEIGAGRFDYRVECRATTSSASPCRGLQPMAGERRP